MKNVLRAAHLLTFITIAVTGADAQLCGQSFERITVIDDAQKPISHAKIVLIGAVPYKQFHELWAKYSGQKPDTQPMQFELPRNEARSLEQNHLPRPTWEYCGNPLNQRA